MTIEFCVYRIPVSPMLDVVASMFHGAVRLTGTNVNPSTFALAVQEVDGSPFACTYGKDRQQPLAYSKPHLQGLN